MKYFIAGRDTAGMASALSGAGFEKDDKKPDFVFCIGGDGTILAAEQMFPSVPKVTIRRSKICKRCIFGENDIGKIISVIRDRKYGLREYAKLETHAGGRVIHALNEIQVHNASPEKAIRFSVFADKKTIEDEVIGDGIVVATPYGSEAYYYSIGGEPFDKGIGIGFNNPHRRIKSIVVGERTEIEIKLLRGCALVIADNSEKKIPLNENESIRITKNKSPAKFVVPL